MNLTPHIAETQNMLRKQATVTMLSAFLKDKQANDAEFAVKQKSKQLLCNPIILTDYLTPNDQVEPRYRQARQLREKRANSISISSSHIARLLNVNDLSQTPETPAIT